MPQTTTKSPKSSPNGGAAVRTGPVAGRVKELRGQRDGAAAREEAWAWIEELSQAAKRDRKGALAELQELFECGRPAAGISGQTEGILVAWAAQPLIDRALGAVTGRWMPWVGKKFDPANDKGINTLTSSARVPAKVLWPLYATKPAPLGREAFEFNTYVEAGKLDPELDVLVIDYKQVKKNPDVLIRSIRDELVEIVPGANLGKMLLYLPGVSKPFTTAYFALKSEI
jgi:hypothetical protein